MPRLKENGKHIYIALPCFFEYIKWYRFFFFDIDSKNAKIHCKTYVPMGKSSELLLLLFWWDAGDWTQIGHVQGKCTTHCAVSDFYC